MSDGPAGRPKFRIDLLGGFSVGLDGHAPPVLPTRKSQALLAYLAVPPGRFHTREKLTSMFWGETPEAQARQSFRQALLTIRRTFDHEPDSILLTRNGAVALDAEAVIVDVALLEAALTDGTGASLDGAATLYKGEFLAGINLNEQAFEEWRALERERLSVLAVAALAGLVDQQVSQAPDAAVQTARRVLAIDPSQEHMQRTLMKLLLRQGHRAAALKQYQLCVDWLERELGIEPEEETRQLYRDILRSAGSSANRPDVVSPPVRRQLDARAEDAPLVGRTAELGILNDALTKMLDVGGRTVLLRGEAGIGKSRLLREFVARASFSGVRILVGRCHETGQILPLHAWIDAMRGNGAVLDEGLLDRLSSAASAQLVRVFPELGNSSNQPVTAPDQYALLFDALVQLVLELSSEQPTIFILEDLHWCDGLSARFLSFLGRRIDRLPILVIGSMRPEELVDAPILAQCFKELRAEGQLDEIPLGALSQADSLTLVQALLPSNRRDHQAASTGKDIWASSEGNPFIIVESVRSLSDDRAHEPNITRTVQEFVAARLDRLAELPRHLVRVAATIGRDFTFDLLARAGRISEGDAAMAVEQLVRRHILITDGEQVDFCHDWIRSVAYQQLIPQQRRVLHAAVGEAIEEHHLGPRQEISDQLGHHYLQAGDARRAIPYLVQFADMASRRYALDEALRAFQQALTAAELLPSPECDRQALDLALRQTFVLSMLGRQREIWEILRTHADQVERVVDPLLTAEYHFRVGLTCFYLGKYAQGLVAGERALSEAERTANQNAIGKALHVLSLIAYETGHPQDGIAHAKRGISVLEGTLEPQWLGLVYHDLALNSVAAGDLDGALDIARQEQTMSHVIRWPRLEALAASVIIWALTLRGDHELALEAARQGLQASRDPMISNLISGSMGLAYLERGDGQMAVKILREVVIQLRKSPVRSGEARCLSFLSEAQLFVGDHDLAHETASRAFEVSQSDGFSLSSGLALRALGRIAFARQNFGEAELQLSRALTTFTECGAAFEVARIQAELAKLSASKHERKRARDYLAAALVGFRKARAPKRIAEARSAARALAEIP